MTSGAITTIITGAGTDLLGQATPVIAAAIGVGIVFWGAKVLWSKYKCPNSEVWLGGIITNGMESGLGW